MPTPNSGNCVKFDPESFQAPFEIHDMKLPTFLAKWLAPAPLGRRGERAAERYLRRRGYKIVARGARDRLGELDLVAVDRRTVVFVEVKTRRTARAGHPADAVDARKQRKLANLALRFLQRHQLVECSSRFDVVAVTWAQGARRPEIEHYINAFEAPQSR